MKKSSKKPLFTPEDLEAALYDSVEFLDSDKAIAGHLSISLLEDYEPAVFLKAIANALRAKGLNTIESLLTIAEGMHAPSASPGRSPIAIKTAGKPAAKRSVKKTAAHPKTRRKREAAVA